MDLAGNKGLPRFGDTAEKKNNIALKDYHSIIIIIKNRCAEYLIVIP